MAKKAKPTPEVKPLPKKESLPIKETSKKKLEKPVINLPSKIDVKIREEYLSTMFEQYKRIYIGNTELACEKAMVRISLGAFLIFYKESEMEVYEKSGDKDVYRSACVGAIFKLKKMQPGAKEVVPKAPIIKKPVITTSTTKTVTKTTTTTVAKPVPKAMATVKKMAGKPFIEMEPLQSKIGIPERQRLLDKIFEQYTRIFPKDSSLASSESLVTTPEIPLNDIPIKKDEKTAYDNSKGVLSVYKNLLSNAILKLKSRTVETVPKQVPKQSPSLPLPNVPPPKPKEHYLMTKLQLIEGDFPLEMPGIEVSHNNKYDAWKVNRKRNIKSDFS